MMKKLLFLLFSVTLVFCAERKSGFGTIQTIKIDNVDHWKELRKAARTGEMPAFLKESIRVERERVRKSAGEGNATRRLNRGADESELLGRWQQEEESVEYTLTVGSDQEIPNPLHVLGVEEAEGAITIDGDSTDAADANYLPTILGPVATNFDVFADFEELEFPLVQFGVFFLDDIIYVSHPDSVAVVVYDDPSSFRFGTFGGKDVEKVTVYAGDPLPWGDDDIGDEDDEERPLFRIIHGITIKDTLSLPVTDFAGNSEMFNVTGEIKHGMLPLMAGVEYPIELPFEFLWGDEEDDELWVEEYHVEFLSDHTGRFIDYWEDLEWDESYTDTSEFVWSAWEDTLAITQEHWEYDEEEDEEYIYTETTDLVYEIEDSVLTVNNEVDYCEDEFDEPLSPYECGDALREVLLFGLNDVESFMASMTIVLDYDGEPGTRTDLEFRQLFPPDEDVVEISADNAWTDTLVFAWESADHIYGDDVKYYTKVTGDFEKFHLITGVTDDNVWKIPYHHIKYYMNEAGLEEAEGTWDVWASDNEGVDATWSSNGYFTLTIDASGLTVTEGETLPESYALHNNFPNPFNPSTTIRYDLPEDGLVTLTVYDMMGREVRRLVNEKQSAGFKMTAWDGLNSAGSQMSAGLYFYRVQAGNFSQTKKMLLLKEFLKKDPSHKEAVVIMLATASFHRKRPKQV